MRSEWLKPFITWKSFCFVVNLYYHNKKRMRSMIFVFFLSVRMSKHNFASSVVKALCIWIQGFFETFWISSYRGISRVILQKLSNYLWFEPWSCCISFLWSKKFKSKMVNALNCKTELLNKNEKWVQVQINKIQEIINNEMNNSFPPKLEKFLKDWFEWWIP